MNRQEIFDTVVRGLASQGWKQALKDGVCTGLAPDGKRCALGHLAELCKKEPEDSIYLIRMHLIAFGFDRFSRQMRDLHDTCSQPEVMRKAFIELAEYEHLIWPSDVPREGDL